MGEKLPRSEIVYFTQIVILFIIIITAIINLSLHSGQGELWITLLSTSIGYILPSPEIRKRSNAVHANPAQ